MDNVTNNSKSKNIALSVILTLYLLGIFMGAIDTGIVSPARTIIQNNLGVNEKTGIWMITIYTLTYAAVIPISGKLADKLGRKSVYLVSIFLFGLGSLICGLSSFYSSFSMLLVGRVIQAIGGGGIMPIATAEFGTSFPEEKRGMALGLVGAVYGIANILGSSIGSAILDIFGTENWKWLFFINLPISVVIIIGGIIFIKNNKTENHSKIDKLGTLFLIAMIVCLLYGLMNMDFFNFKASIQDSNVYPYLIAFALMLPIFIFIEIKVSDPVLKIDYFMKPRILIVLLLSLIVGIGMMGMVFVPQFSENALKIKAGSGGYFVALLGLFAGFGAPISGKLIDKYGSKKVLLFGFSISMIGALYLLFVATNTNSLFSVCLSLIFMGLGMGFTMGTPLNYMMLENTEPKEANSALATLSLIRSIGTSISPAIMIGFLAHAGSTIQDDLMNIIGQPEQPKIVQLQELDVMLNDLKSDPEMAKQLGNINLPNFENNSNTDMIKGTLPKELLDKIRSSDVTTITNITKEVSTVMYEKNVPPVIDEIQSNIQKGIDGMQEGIDGISTGQSELKEAINGVQTGIDNMSKALYGINSGITGIEKAYNGINQGIAGMEKGIAEQEVAISQLKSMGESEEIKAQISQLEAAKNGLTIKLQSSITQRDTLKSKLNDMSKQKSTLKSKLTQTKAQKSEMSEALISMDLQKSKLTALLDKTIELKNEIPKAFKQSQDNYITSIENKRLDLEKTYQASLNQGFKQMYITVFCVNLVAFVVLLFYKPNNKFISK